MMRDETYNASHVLARFEKETTTFGYGDEPLLSTREISFREEALLANNFNVLLLTERDLRRNGLPELFEKIGEPSL